MKSQLEDTVADATAVRGPNLLPHTTGIVAAYIAQNATSRADLTAMIAEVHAALSGLGTPPVPAADPQQPAVSIRKSMSADVLICLDCGGRFQSLKRHLATNHSLTPDAYRQKWSLPADYPMVAPAYSSRRSDLAKTSGLGRKPAPVKAIADRLKKK